MSNNKSKSYDERIKLIKAGLEAAAKDTGEHPGLVDKQKFKSKAKGITEWDLRSVGGFIAIKKELFPMSDDDLAVHSKNKIVTSYMNKLESNVGSSALFRKTLLESCLKAISGVKTNKYKPKKRRVKSKGKKMTMEAMLSDLHYGKKTKIVNLKVLRQRMQEFCEVFLFEADAKESLGFNVETFVVALIGDIIESFTMHGLESAASSEFGNAEQIQSAITSIFEDFLLPVAMTGKKVVCPAVAGNHDRVETMKTMNNPGRSYMSWIIYNMLEQLCKASGLTNVEFIIPDESFMTLDIYGSTILYEHGDKLKNTSKTTIETKIINRQRQIGKTIHMARFGHWHEYVCYDRGRAIVNESLPGPDSYSTEMGFVSTPGQVINFYVETKNRPTSFYYSFPVYLG